ncbi:hypothetical protein [Paraburkholderia terrae]|uniref:Uncharacterized protein n=1 Tax=Paraburkholderia terrae TaxID=311230 RepID=A0A2I8EZC5_9BURK|nr:hypothetical protein [Paraburkholderia terrae]AUT64975.1 hypothetical protein C2L65_35875 [Paraburkholderia terrae]
MSGPKVVRIVTREEILAICEGHLRRLEQAINQWIAEGKRNDELSDQEIAATRERQRQLVELLKADAFMDLQKKVPDEIAFLRADALRREQHAIEKAASARKRARQGRENATTLLSALTARGKQLPADLEMQLVSVAKGEVSDRIESILAQGFALLAPTDRPGLTDAQRELAAKLSSSVETQTFDAWKAAQKSTSPADGMLERVDAKIAEAQTLVGQAQTAMYLSRLHAAEVESSDVRRKLLLDSLIIDLAGSIESERTRRAALHRLTELAAQMPRIVSEDAKALQQRVAACNEATDVETIEALVGDCQSFLDQDMQKKAAQSRREVILHGLARLGYEVHEGMATAWATDGRVVLRKPSLPGYGVEVGGQAESSRLQVRAVALTNDRDSSRDKDVETLWCGEFSKLQQLVAEQGNNLLIERAMAIGQVPLKVVGDTEQTPMDNAKKHTLN